MHAALLHPSQLKSSASPASRRIELRVSLTNTERRLLVTTPPATAYAQCYKGAFLLGKRTRLILALLAAFGGRPGDVFHSGTLLHLLPLVLLSV